MAGWSAHNGTAIALPQTNIDTDQLIPARFMSVPRSQGYGDYLLYDLRRTAEGVLDAGFPLNRHKQVTVLLAGRNFGSGSSREAAVYALVDAGVRVVISQSFGDIFAGNAVNNGLLPARISEADWTMLASELGEAASPVRVDLIKSTIALGQTRVNFSLDESRRVKLVNGWDDIDLTKQHHAEIRIFKDHRHETARWAWPSPD